MKKLIIQGLIVMGSFFVLWYITSLADWMSIFRVEQVSQKAEDKLGELYWDFFSKTGKVITEEDIVAPVDSIMSRICASNNIDKKSIQVHVIDMSEVNAFALPGRHIVVYTGLLMKVENESQLAGVLAHELAHQQEGHIMKRLIKEVGISVLLNAAGGTNNGQVISETAKLLSSTAYDRSLEKRADLLAVDYMITADVNPLPFADFIGGLSAQNNVSKYLSWINTHPGEEERMNYLREYCKFKKVEPRSIISNTTWTRMISGVRETNVSEHIDGD